MSSENKFNILLADNDKDDLFFFRMAIKGVETPLSLTTVSDGEELMNYLKDNINSLPDFLFLDLNMPKKKNGHECLSEN